jgi:hypothetical protein
MTAVVLQSQERDPFRIVAAVQQLAQGRSNATGACTLAAGAASTTVIAPNCAAGSAVFLFPRSAHAAAELAAGTLYISAVAAGAFTLAHANNAQADRSFFWVALG